MTTDTHARRVNADAAARAGRAAELRIAGASWGTVAEECGYAHATSAGRAVRQYLGELPEVEREESRTVWRERLELLWEQAYADVLARRPGAVRAAAAVAQRAASLDGLDQPTAIALHTPQESEYWAVVHRMVELDRRERGSTPAAIEGDPFAASEDFIEAEVVYLEE